MGSARLALCADSHDDVLGVFLADGSQDDCIAAMRSAMGPPQPSVESIAPEVVAKTILYCAEHAVRDVFAGGSGKVTSLLGRLAPRLTDKVMESMFDIQQSDRPEQDRTNSLYSPTEGLKERGGRSSSVFESSVYTQTSLHPIVTGAVVAVAGLTIASLLRTSLSGNGQRRRNPPDSMW